MRRYMGIALVVSLSVLLVAGYLSWTSARAEVLPQTETQQANEPVRTVQVSGVAESQIEPDVAVIRLGVQTEAETAQTALNQNSTRVQALIDRLREADIPAENIQTQTVQLFPRYEFNDTNESRTLVGYTASNVVEVRTEELDAVGGLLDQAVESGANIIESIRFEVSSSERLMDRLREAAVQNARHKAEELAQLTGATLGAILEIQESSSTPEPVPVEQAARGDAAAVPVSPGTQTISIRVEMTWTLNVNSGQ